METYGSYATSEQIDEQIRHLNLDNLCHWIWRIYIESDPDQLQEHGFEVMKTWQVNLFSNICSWPDGLQLSEDKGNYYIFYNLITFAKNNREQNFNETVWNRIIRIPKTSPYGLGIKSKLDAELVNSNS